VDLDLFDHERFGDGHCRNRTGFDGLCRRRLR
jgi:hypothetical protein